MATESKTPSVDYAQVDGANEATIRALEDAVRKHPGAAAAVLRCAGALLEGSAFGELTFDADTEAAIAREVDLSRARNARTEVERGRRTAAVVLFRAAVWAKRVENQAASAQPAA